jgi:D-3-phosphoglycerate dehydrogenase / 2-oxoglutarate reductase
MTTKIALVNFVTPDYTVEQHLFAEVGLQAKTYHDVAVADIISELCDVEVLVVQLEKVTGDMIRSMPHLKLIAREGVGLDSIDLEAASRNGVSVMNVPDYCLEEVAVHACSLLLAAHRKLLEAHRLTSSGKWSQFDQLKPIGALSEQTLGLIGMGRIGVQVISRMRGFGCRIIVSDPFLKQADAPEGIELVSLDQLLTQSDLISIHCPLTEETRYLICHETINKMAKQPILVNVSRGLIIHEGDVVEALNQGKISYAAVDVLEQEPPDPDHPLLHHAKALVTNHMAWYSTQSEARLHTLTAQRVIAFLAGHSVPNIVNRDQLQTSQTRSAVD